MTAAPISFDALARSYNFRHPSDRVSLFRDVVLERVRAAPRPRRVLELGCGNGIAQDTSAPLAIGREADELWGLEPDAKIAKPAHVTNFQHALMETAKLPESYFDTAYSCLVMEHVADPVGFMRALHRVMKPGGEYLFMTMNARHYFVRIASTMRALHVDEFVLRKVRPGVVEDYHYPVQYRFNHPTSIARVCRETGFEEPRFAFVEFRGPAPYFPGPLKPFFNLMEWKRRRFHNPKVLLELYCLVRKPA